MPYSPQTMFFRHARSTRSDNGARSCACVPTVYTREFARCGAAAWSGAAQADGGSQQLGRVRMNLVEPDATVRTGRMDCCSPGSPGLYTLAGTGWPRKSSPCQCRAGSWRWLQSTPNAAADGCPACSQQRRGRLLERPACVPQAPPAGQAVCERGRKRAGDACTPSTAGLSSHLRQMRR